MAKRNGRGIRRIYIVKTIQVSELVYDADMDTEEDEVMGTMDRPMKELLETFDANLEQALDEWGGYMPVETKVSYEYDDGRQA